MRDPARRLMRMACAATILLLAGNDGLLAAELRAGAAKIDITPPRERLPGAWVGINDAIYARAIVVDDGRTQAALVSVDTGMMSTDLWNEVSSRMERDLGIPASHLLLTATHTHSVPRSGMAPLATPIVKAIRIARDNLEPARIASGAGVSYINVNRNIVDPETNRWWEGPNYDGPSDKTVAVIHFGAADGRTIGVLYNYGVHAVINGQLDEISGDIPGAASRYIEDALDDGAVALWSEGTAGDQNPIYFHQTYELRDIRIAAYAERGEDISNSMPPGGQGLDRADPQVAKLMDQQRQLTVSMGQMLGEEVLHTIRDNLQRPRDDAILHGSAKTIYCPGRRRTDSGRGGYAGRYEDAAPVPVRLSLLRLGDIIIGGVDAEVFTQIGQRFKRESPYKNTMMATLTNGAAPSGYIASDAAAGYHTFEVLSSRLKAGCAEAAIVEGLLDLIDLSDRSGGAHQAH